MTLRHFLVYRVSWPLHSFCSHKKTFSGTETERDLRDERSSYRCLRSLLRYMAPLNPTLMAATASQRDLSQKIASRIGFSSRTTISLSVHFNKTVAQISFVSTLWYFQYKSKQKLPWFWKKQDWRNCLLKMKLL